jgi:phage terminase large subunit-like protein
LQEPGVYIDIAKTERAKELIEKYFGFTLFPWELYVLALVHAYIDHGKRVLFNKYFLLMGTGNGKNGFISGLTWYFTTPDHGVKEYDASIRDAVMRHQLMMDDLKQKIDLKIM